MLLFFISKKVANQSVSAKSRSVQKNSRIVNKELCISSPQKKKLKSLTYLCIQYKKKKCKRKERSIRSINPLKLMKRVKNAGRAKRENKFPLHLFH